MAKDKLVPITVGSYAFSRYTVSLLIWLSLILQRREIMIAIFIILLSSVLLKIRRYPLVVIYRQTIDRIWPSRPVEVEENGLRFAHGLALFVSLSCLWVLYFGRLQAGWYLTIVFGVFNTISALGYCPGLTLYHWINKS